MRYAMVLPVLGLLFLFACTVKSQSTVQSFSSQYAFKHKVGLARVAILYWTPRVEEGGVLPIDFAIAVKTQGWVAVGYNLDSAEQLMVQSRVVMSQNTAPSGGFVITERILHNRTEAGVNNAVDPPSYINATSGVDSDNWMWLRFRLPVPTTSPVRNPSTGRSTVVLAARTSAELLRHDYINTAQSLNLASGDGANGIALCDPAACQFGTCSEFECVCTGEYSGPNCDVLRPPGSLAPPPAAAPTSAASLPGTLFAVILGSCCLLWFWLCRVEVGH